MVTNALTYLSAHPVLSALLVLTVLLAFVGLWYVVYNHFKAILVTVLCGGGMLSGIVVLYRGAEAEMRDLMLVGLFLLVAFPIIFWQAVKTEKKVAAAPHLPGPFRLPAQPGATPPPKG